MGDAYVPLLLKGETLLVSITSLACSCLREKGFDSPFRTAARIREAVRFTFSSPGQGIEKVRSVRIHLKGRYAEWEVESFTSPDILYTVKVYSDGRAECTCPDHKNRGSMCKHIATIKNILDWVPEWESPVQEELYLPSVKCPKGVFCGGLVYNFPDLPYQGRYSHLRHEVDGLKIGVEFEILNSLEEEEAKRHLSWLVKNFSLVYERDASVLGGELKSSSPLDIRRSL